MNTKSFTYHPDFDEEKHREACCEGKICPQCLGNNIKCMGSVPDFCNPNFAYDCIDCDAKWEGY